MFEVRDITIAEKPAMENKIKRPVSVWVAQILLGLFALLFLSGVAMLLVVGIQSEIPLVILLVMAAMELFFVALCVAAIWAMAKRRPFGRWLGVAILSLMFILVTLSQLRQASGPFERYEYSNSTQMMSGVLAQIFLTSLILLLALWVAFSKKVSAFFSQANDDFLPNAPPPPPSFDA
jgi:hypothetical protein